MTSAESVAAACRVLAATGLVEHVLGHVSVRTGPDRLLVRCRGPRESGAWPGPPSGDVREVPLAGAPDVGAVDGAQRAADPPGAAAPAARGHRGRARAPAGRGGVLAAGPAAAAGLRRVRHPRRGGWPRVGCRSGPRAALVRTDALAGELADALGDRPVVVLRGHGLVSVAAGPPETAVPQAVLQGARGRHARPQHARGAAGRRHAAGDRRRRPGRAARSRRRLHRRDEVAAPAAAGLTPDAPRRTELNLRRMVRPTEEVSGCGTTTCAACCFGRRRISAPRRSPSGTRSTARHPPTTGLVVADDLRKMELPARPWRKNNRGHYFDLADYEMLGAHISELMPGRQSVRHRHTTEAYLYVVKGHGYSLVNYDDEPIEVGRVVRGHAVRATALGLAPALQPRPGRHLTLPGGPGHRPAADPPAAQHRAAPGRPDPGGRGEATA